LKFFNVTIQKGLLELEVGDDARVPEVRRSNEVRRPNEEK